MVLPIRQIFWNLRIQGRLLDNKFNKGYSCIEAQSLDIIRTYSAQYPAYQIISRDVGHLSKSN